MTKLVEYTERSQEEAKAIANKLRCNSEHAYRAWSLTGEDFFVRTGWLAMYVQNDSKVFFYPLWTRADGSVYTDFPNTWEKCPSLEWFNGAKITTMDDGYEPELIGVNGDKLVW